MKKLLLFTFLVVILCSCEKKYQYVEKYVTQQVLLSDNYKELEKVPQDIHALNDSSAYIIALKKFCKSKSEAGHLRRNRHKNTEMPVSFVLYDENGAIVKPNIPQQILDSIKIFFLGFENSTLQKNEDKVLNLPDSNTIKKLSPLFTFKKDEFDPDGITIIKPKSAPVYVNRNGIFCTFIKSNAGVENFRLHIQYYADDWLFIRKYQFSIDGKAYEFIPLNVERDNEYMIWEWCNEEISNAQDKSLIKALANAKSARIKFIGDHYYDIRTIKTKELKSIKDALDLYVAMGGEW